MHFILLYDFENNVDNDDDVYGNSDGIVYNVVDSVVAAVVALLLV